MAYVESKWEKSRLIPRSGLQTWYMADADDNWDLTNLSPNHGATKGDRDLAFVGAPSPDREEVIPEINNMPGLVWDGSHDRIRTNSDDAIDIKTVWILFRLDQTTFNEYRGILTGHTTKPIILTNNSGVYFFEDVGIPANYSKNGVAFGSSVREAPIGGTWALIKTVAPLGYLPDGLQFGGDRGFASRLMIGAFAEMLGYDREMTALEDFMIARYFAEKYHVWPQVASGLFVFPFSSDWARTSTADKSVAATRSISGVIKQRYKMATAKRTIEAGFTVRSQSEYEAALAFYNERYGVGSWIYRDYTFDPAQDLEVYFTGELQEAAQSYANFGYSFNALEK